MPIAKCIIYNPRRYSSAEVYVNAPKDAKLQAMVQHNMTGVLAQMHALVLSCSEVFGSLAAESKASYERMAALRVRLDKCRSNVGRAEQKVLSATKDPSATFANLSYDARQQVAEDSMLLLRRTAPEIIKNLYAQCRPPPQMSKMNPYMENGEDCLKSYTNPMFFIEEWFKNQQKIRQDMKEKKSKKKKDKAGSEDAPVASKDKKP